MSVFMYRGYKQKILTYHYKYFEVELGEIAPIRKSRETLFSQILLLYVPPALPLGNVRQKLNRANRSNQL